MYTIEFFSEHGGTVAWTPGETVQEQWSHLTSEEFERLREELKEIFGSFINAASGIGMIEESSVRSGIMQMYTVDLGRFLDNLRTALRLQVALDEILDEPDSDSGE